MRAAINLGNKALVQRRSEVDEPTGVSPALARRLASTLDAELEMVLFDSAGAVTRAASAMAWDIAFLAVDPDRLDIVAYTDPYIVIEGTYAVRAGGPIASVAEADREGVRIVASVGSAYELYLRRSLQRATLLPADTPASSMQRFLEGEGDAVAGVRQSLDAFFEGNPGIEVLPGRITAIEQAMAIPVERAAVIPQLNEFLRKLERSGFFAQSFDAQ